jgi:elongation factor Tu
MWQACRAATIAVVAGVVLLSAACKKDPPPPAPPSAPAPVAVISIGHEEHGKATLASAITRVDLNDRGGTFTSYDQLMRATSLPTVQYRSSGATYEHTVCRTHDECMQALNAKQYDGAILVVSGVDGPMPHTREQLQFAWHRGLRKLVVFISKADAQVDPELLQLVELEIKELATGIGFDPGRIKVITGSARHALAGTSDHIGQNAIRQLLEAMDAAFARPATQ